MALVDSENPPTKKVEAKKVETKVEPAPVVIEPTKPLVLYDKCGICGEVRETHHHEADWGWEMPGHPNHHKRDVCVVCAPEYERRVACCDAVYAAMKKKFEADGLTYHAVDEAITVAWRIFHVQYDDDALIKAARQLKVKSPWLVGR